MSFQGREIAVGRAMVTNVERVGAVELFGGGGREGAMPVLPYRSLQVVRPDFEFLPCRWLVTMITSSIITASNIKRTACSRSNAMPFVYLRFGSIRLEWKTSAIS